MLNNKSVLTFNTIILSVAGVIASPSWAEDCKGNSDEWHYQACDNQQGWYIGGDVNHTETDISQARIDRFYNESGLSAKSVDIDDNDIGFRAFVGYQFNRYFALEAGYIDLGERDVSFTGQTSDSIVFYDNVEHVYPQSAEGASINLVASYPFAKNFKVSGKIGYFDWEGDYTTYADNKVGSDTISGSDIWYGVELNYRLASNWQLYTGYNRFELSRDDNDQIGLGLRYFFGGSDSSSIVKAKPAVKPTKSTPVVAVVKPVDSDNDGVIDDNDQCTNSEAAFQVDETGCTVYALQNAKFNLVINYANDSALISPDYHDKLSALATFIDKYNVKQLTVYGHTSAPGSRSYNQSLSEKRAASVAKMLNENYQIPLDVVKTVGKGEAELLDTANTEAAHDKNRRIELAIEEQLKLPVKK